ncbi:hypothetical protein SAMN05216266_110109 [Amycolatopsis marina]|uniref:VOC domain-containing protein n=1 Tax=Amycolatopsis marina TaxID=490629 RepID=A0A1I1ATK9_9PSEU|nr:hypothetical protein [Amycolatopsis marina]SFB40756.1 hypothetical protein SAMN05216266_110109 [Amycolatopsis marina]
MRVRQVTLAARNPQPVIDDLRYVFGIEVSLCETDMIDLWGPEMVDEFGLSTSVLPVGDTFLEVISPTRADAPAARYLTSRGGDTGYMVIIQCTAIEEARIRAAQLGIREVWEGPLDNVRSIHLDPRDTGGALLSLEETDEVEDWPWAGPNWREHAHTDGVTEITGVDITAVAPGKTASRWGELLGRPVRTEEGADTVLVTGGSIRFVENADHGREGLSGIELRCPDPDTVRQRAARRDLAIDRDGRIEIGGVAFRLGDGAPGS